MAKLDWDVYSEGRAKHIVEYINKHIRSVLILPYLEKKIDMKKYDETIYPDLESVPKRYAIVHRNRWMVEKSDILIAYVTHNWGGAAKMLEYAEQKKKVIYKYSDIDYVKQELHIQRQIGKAFVEAEDKLLAVGAQEIPLKTRSSNRILPIPDYVFEEILKEREKYEKNKREKGDAFQDTGYIICSPNGKVRSKDFHYQHYKRLLRENGLPDVRWHDLRSSYCTLLLNNEFNPKAVSILMGHAKEIITVDVYGDHKALMVDCTKEIDMFLEELCLSDQNDQTVDLQHFCLSVEDIMQNKCL